MKQALFILRYGILAYLLISLSPLSFAQKAKVISAYNYLQYNELQKASEAIDVAITNESTKDWHKTWYYRGLIYQSLYTSEHKTRYPDALQKAKESYMKAIELDKKKEFTEDATQKLKAIAGAIYTEGVGFYSRQEYEKAYAQFVLVISVNDFFGTVDTGAVLNAAFSADKANKLHEAKDLYQRLMDYQYKNAAVYQSLAMIYKSEHDTAQALATIQAGRKIFPENKSLIIDELNFYLAGGKISEALDKLNDAIRMDTANPDLYFALGTAYDNLKEREKAKQAYHKALELKPGYFEVLYNLGAMYYNQAIEVNDEMSKLDVKEQEKYEAMKAERDKYFSDALPYFERAYQSNHADINVLNVLKEIYFRLGKQDKSDEMKKKIEEIKGK